jgi:hypothetical protein
MRYTALTRTTQEFSSFLEIVQRFPQVPMVQRYAETAIQVLQANEVEVDTL